MNSANIKRSIVRNGQKTSVSLEKEFWEGLREIASVQNTKLSALVRRIDIGRQGNNLSSAIRVFVFNQLRTPRSRACRLRHPAAGRRIRRAALSRVA